MIPEPFYPHPKNKAKVQPITYPDNPKKSPWPAWLMCDMSTFAVWGEREEELGGQGG